MEFLGLIPARGGSKGVPRKNIKPICGHPLIAWTIQAARASRRLDRVLVSTEDREIAEVSRAYGAMVLERPAELAVDTALSRDVIAHALTATGAAHSVLLQATSPVRSPGLIDRVIEAFQSGPSPGGPAVTGRSSAELIIKDLAIDRDGPSGPGAPIGGWDSMATGQEQALYPPHGVEHRRQDINYVFVNDGSVIISTRATVLAQSLFGGRAGALVTSREENVDIDDEFDFWLAEKVLERVLAQGWDIEPRLVGA